MSRDILNVATFGLLGSKLVGGSKKPPAPVPAPAAPAVMPIADDEAVRKARRRSIVASMSRRGRDSTNLVAAPGGKLGG